MLSGSVALAVYQPRVESKAELLLSRIRSSNGDAVNMTDNAMFYGFDVMADVGKLTSISSDLNIGSADAFNL